MNVTNINSGYGGSQQDIHPTNTKHNFGYLGLHDQIIEVWNENNMAFQGGSNGPLFMTPQYSVSTKCSYYDDKSLIDKTKAGFLGNINSSNVNMSVVKGKRVGEM